MKRKDFLSISDISGEDIRSLISDAVASKDKSWLSSLERKTLAILFEKPSLRTRVSFEMAMRQLGGETIYLSPAEVGLGKRESVPDVARVLSRYVDALAVRTFSHQTLETLAEYAAVPVINALSDLEHPCQALADLLTIYEKKRELKGLRLAFIGDGNNVAHSLLLAAALAGMNFRIASPAGYAVQERILSQAQDYAAASDAEIFCTEEPQLAVNGADIVYTDVWTSMGQEAEAEKRRKVFANFQVNDELMAFAKEDAILMHPLPAHRGEEVSETILDSLQSVVFDQAENRLHAQKAVLLRMLGGLDVPLTGLRWR
ncbi:MAG: ornithine carbamoyltransferase [Dehalococcoidales bacterium]|nr:ornithine carbamoyltransferase [Dehalococcoidales bacterium]